MAARFVVQRAFAEQLVDFVPLRLDQRQLDFVVDETGVFMAAIAVAAVPGVPQPILVMSPHPFDILRGKTMLARQAVEAMERRFDGVPSGREFLGA